MVKISKPQIFSIFLESVDNVHVDLNSEEVFSVKGSRAEHEEFAGLSEDEAKRRLATIIDRMDVDSDGRISKQELINWVFNSFQ